MRECFFCAPEKGRILYDSEYFYALLGLGQIVEGYILLVSKQHVRSIFDLPLKMKEAYLQEKQQLKKLINNVYGPLVVTEHGRVQSCVVEDEEAHDLLCYHAHQLFFPIEMSLGDLSKEGPFEKVFDGTSLFQMNSSLLQDDDEYLLFEDNSDRVFVYKVHGKCPRQYMRYLVARSIGRPELANWAKYPRMEQLAFALDKYRQVMKQDNTLKESETLKDYSTSTPTMASSL